MRPGSSRTPPTAKDWVGPDRIRGKERTGSDTTGPMCPSTPRAKRNPRPKSSWLSIRGPLTGLPTTPALPGDQKSLGYPARLLPSYEQPSTGPRTTPPPDGDRSPTHRAGGAKRRRRDGETRSPLERKLETREGFTTDSGRVACEKVLCLVAEVLEVAKERGSTGTSEELSGPSS